MSTSFKEVNSVCIIIIFFATTIFFKYCQNMYCDDCEGVIMHSSMICRSDLYMYVKLIIYKSTCQGQDFPLGICKVKKLIKENQGNL